MLCDPKASPFNKLHGKSLKILIDQLVSWWNSLPNLGTLKMWPNVLRYINLLSRNHIVRQFYIHQIDYQMQPASLYQSETFTVRLGWLHLYKSTSKLRLYKARLGHHMKPKLYYFMQISKNLLGRSFLSFS